MGSTSQVTKVSLKDNLFVPADVVIYQGETVEWTNRDPFGHDVTLESGVSSGGPGQMGAGTTWSHEIGRAHV